MKKFEYRTRNLFTLGTLLVGLSGCSHGPIVQDFPETASATDEVSKFEVDVQTALTNQIDVLAPKSFDGAKRSLEEAKFQQNKEKNPRDILHTVAEGRYYLNQANQLASIAKSHMDEVLSARQDALTAGAPRLFPKDLQVADNHLRDLTSEVENNEFKNIDKKRGELQKEYINLEIQTLKEAHLSLAKATLRQAVDEGAKELAPQTLAEAEKQIKDTDAFIFGYRNDLEKIKSRSSRALASAEHVLQIAREAKLAKKITPEEIALRMEQEKNRLALQQNQLAQEKNTTRALVEENSTLASARDFNRQFEEAQAEFSPREAEVYKQGNKLLIRLKGLEFPVAQALLKGSNFALLTKVQKVINKFGKGSVLVEGHTDATGDKAVNDKLSLDRAMAVRDYLKSSLNTDDIELSAVGHGYQKPLATNKTSDGRAQNRRVDVIISPELD